MKKILLLLLVLLLLLLLAGCVPPTALPEDTPTVEPTATITSTHVPPTNTAIPTNTATAEPTVTNTVSSPIATPTPLVVVTPYSPIATPVTTIKQDDTGTSSVTTQQVVIARSGPGENYVALGHFEPGEDSPVVAQYRTGDWIQLYHQCHTYLGWVRVDLVEVRGDYAGVPVIEYVTPPSGIVFDGSSNISLVCEGE